MSNVSSRYDDEINLLDLIETIWDGKWRILSVIAFSLLLVFGFNIVKPTPTFTATTNIKPISSFDFDKYRYFNSYVKLIGKQEEDKDKDRDRDRDRDRNKKTLNYEKYKIKNNFFEITPNYLINLYVEHIENGSILKIAVDKFNLLNKENFDSERDYKKAIQKFVSQIEVLKPTQEVSHYIFKGKYNNKDKWENLLVFVNDEVNTKVKSSIISRFETKISSQNQIKNFIIEDIDIKIETAKKFYFRNIKDRLAFLYEQATIARKLDLKKNTIAFLTFNSENTFSTNVKSDAPYYLRGYLPIEEEINQIKNRKDKTSFIKDLSKLEQQKIALEADLTIQRTINLFKKTPLYQTDFKATAVNLAATNYETKSNSFLLYSLTILLGGFIGVVYVLIKKAFQNLKKPH